MIDRPEDNNPAADRGGCMNSSLAADQTTALVYGHSAEALHIICLIIFVFCGVKALFHKDLKKILIYSLVGLVVDVRSLLTIDSPFAFAAFLFHVFNFFVCIGMMYMAARALEKAVGSNSLDDMRGAGRVVPRIGIPLAAGLFAMMGLPPFATFFSKLVMVSAFIDAGGYVSPTLLAAGELLYFLVFIRVIKIVFLDRYKGSPLQDREWKNVAPLYGLLVFSVIGGLIPQIAVKPFLPLAGLMGAPGYGIPPLTISWPLPVLWLMAGAAAVYYFGRTSNKKAGLLSSLVCLSAMPTLLLSSAGVYGLSFAVLILFMATLQFFYSVSYMEHSHHQYRFYTCFLIMISGLLGVSLSQDIYSTFFFWEIMSGWIMYLALAHEEDAFSVQEATKYFIFNYLGAAFLVVGILIMYDVTGHWDYGKMAENFQYTERMAFAVLLLTIGFIMKAAQLPFRIDYWMHPKPAPTPISGYISSTVLKSGPFMMVKIFFIASLGATATTFLPLDLIKHVSGWIGALTIIMAASFAMLTNSMKRLLIFHTVSQLGYVIVGCSLMTSMGLAGGLLHFVNHMFFKNLLFLCAGAVFISTGTDKMDQLGGLGRKMPLTFICFMIGVLSISGVPLFSGFISKWIIYHAVMDTGYIGIAILSLFGSVLTLASFVKFMHSAFLGQMQDRVREAREASWYMLVPMSILAGLSVLLGIFPGMALMPINSMLVDFNLQPLQITISSVTDGVDSINMLFMLAALSLGMGVAGLLYFLTRTKTRKTHVFVCGVDDLTPEDSHVSSVNCYEDAKKIIKGAVKLMKKTIGLKGDYVER